MVKYRSAPKKNESGHEVTTKSPCGSHTGMVVEPEEVEPNDELYLVHLHHSEVVCKDDKGYYITLKSRLDNGLADPNRYDIRRES